MASASDRLGYNADVRPILVEHCFSCHGADSGSRKADLRLDRRENAVEHGAIAAGDPDSSMMLDRIFSDDPEEVMPPPALKKPLSAEQKEILRKWIAEGAEYQPHWSFIPPSLQPPPAVTNEVWVRNTIDRFILARLEKEGLETAPEADRRTLARRVALDITGLPPDPALVDAFVGDGRPDAYERFVDTLLAMPEWGEHRGRYWLDYARYADTHGLHYDGYREMWSYRQWVIDAFNRNLPFDQFTIQQLAGDLVAAQAESASLDDRLASRIASGFHRCNVTTAEGGSIPQECLVLYARDRTDTTATVWMGLTAGCAVCHDHKFDPFTQRDFYSLSAFFNHTTQAALDGNAVDTPPMIVVPVAADRERFAVLEKEQPAAKQAVDARKNEGRKEFDAWLERLAPADIEAILPQDTPLFNLACDEGRGDETSLGHEGRQRPLRLASTRWIEGPGGRPALELNGKAAEVADIPSFEHDRPFSVVMQVRVPADAGPQQTVIGNLQLGDGQRGWEAWIRGGTVGFHLIHSWPSEALRVTTGLPAKPETWTSVTITYDGKGTAESVRIFADGKALKSKTETKSFKGSTIRSTEPLMLGARKSGGDTKGLGLAALRIYGRVLSEQECGAIVLGDSLLPLVGMPPAERVKLGKTFYDQWLRGVDHAYQAVSSRLQDIDREIATIRKRGTIAHVMNEKPGMPEAFVLSRGEYDKPLDKVHPNTPAALPPFPDALPRNRLGLAQWLLMPEHPLTARVVVNRFWQEVFGTGLVRTTGDFGTTGELPSHPELLDWLAVEFRESGWDVKQLFRLMVTSAAYRQKAAATPEKLAKDEANRLLSRGPRFRMDAEMIRDHALAASGLLVRRIGGPSVKPYQPEGVWEAVSIGGNTRNYEQDRGDGLYRRSLYWFWKRAAPPASLEVFNAPTRETCCVKRERTNTPLQALVTFNDPQLIEAARTLADGALATAAADDDRIDFMATRLLARPLAAEEKAIVRESLEKFAGWYSAHVDDAAKLIAVGASKPRTTDPSLLAAWTMLANELMNYDEVLCK
ncbi:MAG: DUF1553 domain-containing protein [Planctomycetia bacterium]|nr:DUF1553 domain-containing protein [Planctomycetia bacterium]